MAEQPTYYRRGTIEVWDFIRDQRLNYHLGNAIKYICRAGYKDDKYIQDLTKAIHYLQNELFHAASGGIPQQNGTGQQPFSPPCTTDFDR